MLDNTPVQYHASGPIFMGHQQAVSTRLDTDIIEQYYLYKTFAGRLIMAAVKPASNISDFLRTSKSACATGTMGGRFGYSYVTLFHLSKKINKIR